MTPQRLSRFFRRAYPARGPVPAPLLPTLAALCALVLPPLVSPALADQVNPAGHVIHSNDVGMITTTGETLTNLGGIEVTESPSTGGYLYGMLGGGGGITTNYGEIKVTATGQHLNAHGMDVNGIATNYGSITATSAGGDAHGIMLERSGTVANYGVIRVSAPGGAAHELNVKGGDTASTLTLGRLTAWALELRDFSTDKTRPFGVSGNGTLEFDNSRLILRPGSAAQGFAWGQEYSVASMVASTSSANPAVTGSVASVTAELPLLEARLTGTDWSDQKVSLRTNVRAGNNPGQSAGLQAVGNARSGMQHLSGVLAGQLAPLAPQNTAGKAAGSAGNSLNSRPEGMPSGDPLAPDQTDAAHWQVFAAPYFSSAANHDQNYTSNSVGMVMGGTWRFNENFAGGLHLGYSGSRTWGDLMDTDNSAQSGLAGLHAVFNFTPQWYLRGQFTGFISRYHNNYQSGLAENPIYADSEFNGHGLYAALHGGYAWQINENNTLTPEIGLSWLWSHQDGSSLRWTSDGGAPLPAYDMDFDAQDYSALYGTAIVRWRGDFALGGERAGNLRPALGLGLRQTLTSGEVESRMRFAGSSFSTNVTEDRTTALAEAGLEWQHGGFAAGLAYTGEYGAQQEVHTGWLTMKFEF